ncbi:hypothetical protein HS961_14130 [Comamonas piscis]|uniref:Uncharacterized protein n=1 Tax=Comamonas piscis TaxID=1562974 RepID=A0A7G5EIQ5_9BURK|nr:hypothetical protein HS961_14130 [Comamonas piscis]
MAATCQWRTTSGKFQGMYLIAIAWLYVVVLMAVVEAVSPQGSVLGAFFTLLLYGALPLGLLLFIAGTPARRRKRHQAEAEAQKASPLPPSDPS